MLPTYVSHRVLRALRAFITAEDWSDAPGQRYKALHYLRQSLELMDLTRHQETRESHVELRETILRIIKWNQDRSLDSWEAIRDDALFFYHAAWEDTGGRPES